MARKKNATFNGVSWSDGKPNAATYGRALADVAGDQALIFDKITGENAEAQTTTHSGVAGRGAIIRHVLVSQHFGGRSLALTNPAASGNGGFGTFNIISVPIFIPQGIDTIGVEVRGRFILNDVFNSNARVLLTDTGLVETDTQPLIAESESEDGAVTVYRARVDVGAGGLCLLFVQMDITDEIQNGQVGTIDSWSVTCALGAGSATAADVPYNDGTAYIVRTPGTTVPTVGVNVRDFDSTMFDDESSINAWITQGMNVNINSLLEYVTGWPAHGNTAYVQRDDDTGGAADAVNPARSRFLAHTRANYTSEPMPRWPFICMALGAHKEDGSFAVDPSVVSPTTGMLDFYAPFPVQIALSDLAGIPVVFPDFSTSGAKLAGAILCGSNGAATVSNWTTYAQADPLGADPAVSDDFGTLTAVTASNDLWLAQNTDMTGLWGTTLPDVVAQLRIQASRGAAKPASDEICVLGFCLWFTE